MGAKCCLNAHQELVASPFTVTFKYLQEEAEIRIDIVQLRKVGFGGQVIHGNASGKKL